MNSELYGKTYTVPQDVIEYLEQCNQAVGEVDETTEGFKRNKDLREKKQITYQQLKRMKNWFDNFNGHQDETSHILNGGHYVRNWVNNTLKGDRDTIETGKQSKSEVLPNQYIDSDKLITFDHFFVRKVMFMKYAQGFIVLPGGFGTFDELFEAITLIQTRKIGKFPIILVGKKYWGGLLKWINEEMLAEEHNISPEDLNLFTLVDTSDEAVDYIVEFYSQNHI